MNGAKTVKPQRANSSCSDIPSLVVPGDGLTARGSPSHFPPLLPKSNETGHSPENLDTSILISHNYMKFMTAYLEQRFQSISLHCLLCVSVSDQII